MSPLPDYSGMNPEFTEDFLKIISSSDAGSKFIWTWRETLLSITLGFIVVGTIFGNFLVLYSAVTRPQHLRLPTHFIIANLAVADFLVGVLVLPFLATLQVTGNWYFGPIYCEAWTVIHFWLCSGSILSTCAVCIERYIGVRYPLNHKQIMNSRNLWTMIICVWILGGTLTLSSLYIWPQPKSENPLQCAINQQKGHVIVAVVGILYVPALTMIILYWRIYAIVSEHMTLMKNRTVISATSVPPTSDSQQRSGFARLYLKIYPNRFLRVQEQESSTSTSGIEVSLSDSTTTTTSTSKPELEPLAASSSSSSGPTDSSVSVVKATQQKKQYNLAKRLSFLVGVLLASYLPFFTLYLVMPYLPPNSVDLRLFAALGWIRYFNSCLNPMIYAFAVPAYRKAMLEIMRNGLLTTYNFFWSWSCCHWDWVSKGLAILGHIW